MGKTPAVLLALLAALALPVGAAAQDVKKVIEDASETMGVVGLDAVTYSGTAAIGNFGQSRRISFGLTSTQIRNYTRTIDFTKPASRATGDMPGAPGVPQPEPGNYDEMVSPATPEWEHQLLIWTTPWGFLRGAASASNAKVRKQKIDDVEYRVVTWSPAQKAPSGESYRLAGYINFENLIARVETWVEHPILGDMHVEFRYRDYDKIGTIMVPRRIARRDVGMETFVVAIKDADANPDGVEDLLALSTPPARAPQPQAVAATSEKLADGVYRIDGGYTALAVEFKDHVVVVEAGESEARGLAIIGEVKRLFPRKKIKFVVNTHPHFDHALGLPPFVAEGATIITDDPNKFFVDAALASPRTLVGDVLARSGKKPKVEGVIETMQLRDETRTVDLHHMLKLEHSDGMLLVHLPKERILFTADFRVPAAGDPVSPSLVQLVENIERLGIDFDRHVMVHASASARQLSKSELVALVKGAR
jgi:glyoxylase-like metal-dependent hydrolase (beta-lactamase superfamily II)